MKSLTVGFVAIFSTTTALANVDLSPSQRQKLMDVLVGALKERGSWISVHAAEALITIGNNEPVRAAFGPQAETAEPPFRIGVWRILARSAATKEDRDAYVERIRKVMLDPSATDRTHAFEALAKVKAPFASQAERQATLDMANSRVERSRHLRPGDWRNPMVPARHRFIGSPNCLARPTPSAALRCRGGGVSSTK